MSQTVVAPVVAPDAATFAADVTAGTRPYPMPFTRLEACVLTVLQGRLCALLIKRAQAPYKDFWAMPGGVLRIDLDGSLEDAAQRVALERLGCALPYLRQQCATGAKDRDPRAPWTLAVVYRALLKPESIQPVAGKRVDDLAWLAVDGLHTAALAFDHGLLVAQCVQSLRQDVAAMHLPFEAFPETFTLGELQRLCEEVLGCALDKSSFRRKLDARGLVQAVEGEVRGGANRPAQLYRAACAV